MTLVLHCIIYLSLFEIGFISPKYNSHCYACVIKVIMSNTRLRNKLSSSTDDAGMQVTNIVAADNDMTSWHQNTAIFTTDVNFGDHIKGNVV